MPLDRRTREQMLAHCGELHEDDGVDPRQYFDARSGRKTSRKVLRLCRQVAKTLDLVLTGEFDDELLHNLRVESVTPAPNASQLAVTLRTTAACDSAELERTRERLAAVSGRLRWEAAAAINRKRAPNLVFHVVGRAFRKQ